MKTLISLLLGVSATTTYALINPTIPNPDVYANVNTFYKAFIGVVNNPANVDKYLEYFAAEMQFCETKPHEDAHCKNRQGFEQMLRESRENVVHVADYDVQICRIDIPNNYLSTQAKYTFNNPDPLAKPMIVIENDDMYFNAEGKIKLLKTAQADKPRDNCDLPPKKKPAPTVGTPPPVNKIPEQPPVNKIPEQQPARLVKQARENILKGFFELGIENTLGNDVVDTLMDYFDKDASICELVEEDEGGNTKKKCLTKAAFRTELLAGKQSSKMVSGVVTLSTTINERGRMVAEVNITWTMANGCTLKEYTKIVVDFNGNKIILFEEREENVMKPECAME